MSCLVSTWSFSQVDWHCVMRVKSTDFEPQHSIDCIYSVTLRILIEIFRSAFSSVKWGSGTKWSLRFVPVLKFCDSKNISSWNWKVVEINFPTYSSVFLWALKYHTRLHFIWVLQDSLTLWVCQKENQIANNLSDSSIYHCWDNVMVESCKSQGQEELLSRKAKVSGSPSQLSLGKQELIENSSCAPQSRGSIKVVH